MELKPGARATVIHAPENYLARIKHDAEVATSPKGNFDWVRTFVQNKAGLEQLAPKAAKALHPNAMLWISFPI